MLSVMAHILDCVSTNMLQGFLYTFFFFFLLFGSKCPKDTQVLFDCILLTISDVEQHFHNSVGHFCVFFGECSIEIFVSLMDFLLLVCSNF